RTGGSFQLHGWASGWRGVVMIPRRAISANRQQQQEVFGMQNPPPPPPPPGSSYQPPPSTPSVYSPPPAPMQYAPQYQGPQPTYAGFWIRLVARLIDG